jgi:aflatoxin B1 aldehyde reductase
MPPPKFVIGNIAYDDMIPQEEVEQLIPLMKELGLREADASPRWPIQSPGTLEPMLGMLAQIMGRNYLMDSRVECKGNGDGTMTADAIAKSLDRTLSVTGYPKVSLRFFRLQIVRHEPI